MSGGGGRHGVYSQPSPSSFTRHDSTESVMSKPRRCTRKQKKCCLGACAVISSLIIVLIVTIYLVSPLIVRKHANHSTLIFEKVVLTKPQHDRVDMEAQIVMGELSSPVQSILDAMEMTMVYEGVDMATTQMDAVELVGETEVHITQKSEMRVLSTEQFEKFSRDLLSKTELTWTLRGDLSAKLKVCGMWIATPYAVEFSKDVTVPGFDHLKNISFDSLDIMVEPDTNRTMYAIRVQAYAASVFDMVPVGDLAFNAFFEDKEVGVVKAKNASVYSGPQGTLLELYGYFPRDPTVVTDMMSAYTNGEQSKMAARFSVNDSEIVLYDLSALAEHPIEMEVNGMQEELIQAALAGRSFVDTDGNFTLPAQFLIWNPFNSTMFIESFNYTVLRDGSVVSQAAQKLVPSMKLNAMDLTLGTSLNLHPKTFLINLLSFPGLPNIADMGAVVDVMLSGSFELSVGDLKAHVRYYSRKPLSLCWCTNPDPCGLEDHCDSSELRKNSSDIVVFEDFSTDDEWDGAW